MPPRKVSLDDEASRKAAAPKPAQLKYSRKLVEALVKMLEGVATFLPAFREAPFSDVEHKWLVDDWYEFGLSSVPFQRLVLSLFSSSTYARLVTSHVGVFGTRLVAYEQSKVEAVNLERSKVGAGAVSHPLPINELGLVASAAYIARASMQDQDVLIEQLNTEQAESVESGGTRSRGGENGVWEDLAAPLPA